MKEEVIQGDCLEVMKDFPDNSIDAVVTDPPYGLSFMGKKWDYDVPSIEIWQECLRVLKPGGYLLSFAGTRTQHKICMGIEDAGFEIRDMIAWVYGSGFPKSLNIGKAVDKLQGNEREDLGVKTSSSYPDSDGVAIYKNRSQSEGSQVNTVGMPHITKGTSEWEGWGTALKPALEPITVARKPLSEKTVAENVLKWGTGGINIDGCRVGTTDKLQVLHNETEEKDLMGNMKGKDAKGRKIEFIDSGLGRFPANLILDDSDEVVSLFPNTNPSKSANRGLQNSGRHGGLADIGKNIKEGTDTVRGHNDNGGSASRFFYCAKASKSERNKSIDNAFQRGETLRNNNHPTVKPIALMEYLVKLVSREGAVVLDPFAGSGSTLIACKNLNRNYIGIEKEPQYIEIINKRLFQDLII
jgi:site-specific DNA-methyltransferase (adenine-specific)